MSMKSPLPSVPPPRPQQPKPEEVRQLRYRSFRSNSHSSSNVHTAATNANSFTHTSTTTTTTSTHQHQHYNTCINLSSIRHHKQQQQHQQQRMEGFVTPTKNGSDSFYNHNNTTTTTTNNNNTNNHFQTNSFSMRETHSNGSSNNTSNNNNNTNHNPNRTNFELWRSESPVAVVDTWHSATRCPPSQDPSRGPPGHPSYSLPAKDGDVDADGEEHDDAVREMGFCILPPKPYPPPLIPAPPALAAAADESEEEGASEPPPPTIVLSQPQPQPQPQFVSTCPPCHVDWDRDGNVIFLPSRQTGAAVLYDPFIYGGEGNGCATMFDTATAAAAATVMVSSAADMDALAATAAEATHCYAPSSISPPSHPILLRAWSPQVPSMHISSTTSDRRLSLAYDKYFLEMLESSPGAREQTREPADTVSTVGKAHTELGDDQSDGRSYSFQPIPLHYCPPPSRQPHKQHKASNDDDDGDDGAGMGCIAGRPVGCWGVRAVDCSSPVSSPSLSLSMSVHSAFLLPQTYNDKTQLPLMPQESSGAVVSNDMDNTHASHTAHGDKLLNAAWTSNPNPNVYDLQPLPSPNSMTNANPIAVSLLGGNAPNGPSMSLVAISAAWHMCLNENPYHNNNTTNNNNNSNANHLDRYGAPGGGGDDGDRVFNGREEHSSGAAFLYTPTRPPHGASGHGSGRPRSSPIPTSQVSPLRRY